MRLVIRVLGLTLIDVEASTEDVLTEAEEGAELAGGCLSTNVIGFTPSAGDQRWETGAGGGEL